MNPTPIKLFLIIIFAGMGLGLTGCAGLISSQPRSPLPASSPETRWPTASPDAQKPGLPEEHHEPEKTPGPRAAASLQMTEQGRKLLEQKKVDEAIKVLERAVNLNPSNGQNYYYLAEA
jgi:hypothetical protein